MGTHSRIGILNPDKSVDSIYCHYDGYLSGNGAILVRHYTDEAKIRAMISLGDMSSLRKEVSPAATQKHSFDTPADDVCVFYGRDRGETDIEAVTYKNVAEMVDEFEGDYNYIFRNGSWYEVKRLLSGHLRYLKLTERNTL